MVDVLDGAVGPHPQHGAVDGAGVDRALVAPGGGDHDVLGAVVVDLVDGDSGAHAHSLL